MTTDEELMEVGPATKPEAPKEEVDPYEGLAQQVQAEYNLAWKHQSAKIDEWSIRLKLYNNQKRAKEDVGDTTMFTIFQTVLASLYIDRLAVIFRGREDGDEDTGENLTLMAENDYVDMEKDELDYNWLWNTLFFGRGLVLLQEYERDSKNKIYLPLPENIDPLSWLKDPDATSVNGDRKGNGSALYMGRPIKMTRDEVKTHPYIFDDDFRGIRVGNGPKNLLQKAQEARDTAQGRDNQKKGDTKSLGVNTRYNVTEWYTHWTVKGKVVKVKVWLANERSKVIGIQILKSEAKRVFWPIIDRPLYPTSGDWDGTSIPDLTEDKQRQRAIAQNLGIKLMTADLYPMYIYDSTKITNRKDLNFGFNKFVPMDGKGENLNSAIMPLNKANPNLGLLNFIYTSLDLSAQKATATPDIQQGMQSEKDRPLGETNLLQSNVTTRYSLSAKILGWSEKRFWQQWYRLYKDNFQDNIDEKILRLEGAFGPKWRGLGRDNMILNLDPDIKIESQILSRAKQLEERQSLTEYYGFALQDPTANRRWGLKNLGTKYGLKKDEIDRLFPPTIDERIAEDENDLLNKDKLPLVKAEDDHNVHLEMHSKARDTNAKEAHVETHKKALSIKKVKPELFPEDQEQTAYQDPESDKLTPPNSSGGGQVPPSRSSGQAVA